MRKGKNHIFAVTNAEVFKSPFAGNSYIIFGIPQLENAGLAKALAGMAQQQQYTLSDNHDAVEEIPVAASKLKKEDGSKYSDKALSEGLDEKDVHIVME